MTILILNEARHWKPRMTGQYYKTNEYILYRNVTDIV